MAAGWKIDAAIKPFYYNHRQSGELADVTGSALVFNSYVLSLHKKINSWQFEVGTHFAKFPFKVKSVSPQSHFYTHYGKVHWKENFLLVSRNSTPFVENEDGIKIRQLTIKWAGYGRNIALWNPHWKGIVSIAFPLSTNIENYNVKDDSGYQLMAGIRFWQRLKWQKKTWNFNISLFDNYTKLNLKLDGTGGSNTLTSHQINLAAGLAKQF